MLEENGLEADSWLKQLYDIRHSWVPVYNLGTFYTGMNTTGRSEGINAFFYAFVTSQTNLREFVVKYEQALHQIVKRESDEDFESEHKYRIVDENDFLLKHASEIYTRNMFKKFKDEWEEAKKYKVEEMGCDDAGHIYLVKSKVGDHGEFVGNLDLQTYIGKCECKKFEFAGIPCRHVLKVFVRLDIDRVPPHFILNRWRKEANKFRVMDSGGLLNNDIKDHIEALRLSHLCQELTKLACYASGSLEYNLYVDTLKELSKKIEFVVGASSKSMANDKSPMNTSEHEQECMCTTIACQVLLLDPNISQTKGRKKDIKHGGNGKGSDRMKSGIELARPKKRRKERVVTNWITTHGFAFYIQRM